jgi:starvation-inducible outer membrane lipoprotein
MKTLILVCLLLLTGCITVEPQLTEVSDNVKKHNPSIQQISKRPYAPQE